MKALTGHYKLDLKGIVVLGKLEAGKGLPFGLPFQPKLWKYAHETVSSAHHAEGTNKNRRLIVVARKSSRLLQ